jgi:predicted PurR-regulated permease PerM
VIVAIGCGVLVAGIAGALVAVPLASAVNAVVNHLARGAPDPAASRTPTDDPPGDEPGPDDQEEGAVDG